MTTAIETRDCPASALPADEDLSCRIRGEYLEMPGLRLTIEQAIRLFSLDRSTCHRILNRLEKAGFLARDGNGRYMRYHGGY